MEGLAWRGRLPHGRGQRGWTTFVIRARTAHRVSVDHHARIAECHALAARWRLDGLVVDARVGHEHAELLESLDRAPLQPEHALGVAQHTDLGEVGAARIGNGGHAYFRS